MLKMIELPYPITALEPYYSAQTLDLHYNILYKGYVDNANKTEEALAKARETGDFNNIKCLEKNLSFYGSGVILHQLFFENMAPYTSQISMSLNRQIEKDFKDFATFKKQFTEAAIAVEASGWCILAWVPEFSKLEILQCEKHQDLTLWGCIPIFVIDMWEHSYYLQYYTSRPKYIEAFWNIVNWNVVNRRFDKIGLLFR